MHMLVHMMHWMHEETEKGGPFAFVGIILGLFWGYHVAGPPAYSSDTCPPFSPNGRSSFLCAHTEFAPERLFTIVFFGLLFGGVGTLIAWLIAQGSKSSE
jgi:hypothetical protein